MNILIIGKNSYIGNHIGEWLTCLDWKVTQLDVLTKDWINHDYSYYDAIVHVAGIVHCPKCKDWDMYKRVNTDMPIAIATIAKKQGVKSFIFLSTMGVYGITKKLHPNLIDRNTPLKINGNSMYGKSKLMAEKGLNMLQDSTFNVVIVRPPSVYGKGCKGGYISGFMSIAQTIPIIPRAFENVKQSFIYIDNLSEFVRLAIKHNLNGSFCPQDELTVSANDLLKAIAKGIGLKYRSSRFLGFCMYLVCFVPLINKVYGGVEYSKELSEIKGLNYNVVPFEEAIKRTVS